MRRLRLGAGPLWAWVALGVVACASAPSSGTAGAGDGAAAPGGDRVASGSLDRAFAVSDSTGFLDQGDVTIRMAGAGLRIDILPMNAQVVSLATDDLRIYLQEAYKRVPDSVPSDLKRDGTYFLVGFSSTEKEIPFEPSLVALNSEGRQYYPRAIVPISAGFEDKVLRILSAPVWAVYVYDPGIDLVSTLEFTYGDDLSTGAAWRRVVQNVELARSRAAR